MITGNIDVCEEQNLLSKGLSDETSTLRLKESMSYLPDYVLGGKESSLCAFRRLISQSSNHDTPMT